MATPDPPAPPSSTSADPAHVVDALEERIRTEEGDPLDREPGPAPDAPADEPPG